MNQSSQPDPPLADSVEEPTLRALMLANLRVLAGVAVLAAAAWGLWFALSKLFPEQSWLQIGQAARLQR